jgi:hypothetical protein
MASHKLALATLFVVAISVSASAIVIQIEATPAFVRENPQLFSVTAEKQGDGLIHFKVVYKVSEPRWLVAHLVVWKDNKRVLESSFPAVVRERQATYWFSMLPEYVGKSVFELSDSGVIKVGDQIVGGEEGGTEYVLQLGRFAPRGQPPARQ